MKVLTAALLLLGTWTTTQAAEVFVSPSGSDANPGTKERP